eukprot:6174521-Pleurochrysis_carterae.AAC.10
MAACSAVRTPKHAADTEQLSTMEMPTANVFWMLSAYLQRRRQALSVLSGETLRTMSAVESSTARRPHAVRTHAGWQTWPRRQRSATAH